MPPPDGQAAQAGLATAIAPQIEAAAGTLNLADVGGTFDQFTQLLAALVHKYGLASATLAVRQYGAERAAAGVLGRFRPAPANPADLTAVRAMTGWATTPDVGKPLVPEQVQRRLQVGAEKLVLDAGRNTIVGNTRRDAKATGWFRLTEPDPCAFCALMATRGVVYRSERSADFRSHDRCRCHAAPDFGGYSHPPQVAEWEQLYRQATRGVHGTKPALAAFQKAYRATYEPAGPAST